MPLNGPFPDCTEVSGRQLKKSMMAVTEHCGPYEKLAPAYHILSAWVTENGYEFAESPREIYVNDPRTVPPEELLTRLEFPICSDEGTEP